MARLSSHDVLYRYYILHIGAKVTPLFFNPPIWDIPIKYNYTRYIVSEPPLTPIPSSINMLQSVLFRSIRISTLFPPDPIASKLASPTPLPPPLPSVTPQYLPIYPHGYSFSHSPAVAWHNISAFLWALPRLSPYLSPTLAT